MAVLLSERSLKFQLVTDGEEYHCDGREDHRTCLLTAGSADYLHNVAIFGSLDGL
jgi:hypothetical protein